jgi:hypothetical protein
MSGGHFDYIQHRIRDAAEEIEGIVRRDESAVPNDDRDEYGETIHGVPYKPETLAKFRECEAVLRTATAMLQRVDWLVSCDDDEESFHERWDADLARLRGAAS